MACACMCELDLGLQDHNLESKSMFYSPYHKQIIGGGGTLRNELDYEVMLCHLTNSHVVEKNRHQNNVKALHQKQNVSTQFDGVKTFFF